MITRRGGYLLPRTAPASAATEHLERDGYTMLRGALSSVEIAALCTDTDRLFSEPDRERRSGKASEEYRYAALNRSAVVQELISSRVILDVIEPLIGEDCHVIANTAWRNPAGRAAAHGGVWHCDAGPHVPRPAGVPWPTDVPYPVFVVAAHVLLAPMPIESGPTGVIPGSHRSGQAPPDDRRHDLSLEWDGNWVVPLVAETGDIQLFVSDIWHRRMPTLQGDPGRDFLQIHYGRRDIAQRLHTTEHAHQLSPEAVARAGDDTRARSVVGLHDPRFYDG